MRSTTASLCIDVLRHRLDDLIRIPLGDRRAASDDMQQIETELRVIPAQDAAGPRTAALAREALFILADLLPGVSQNHFAGQRGSPEDHPPLADILAALGIIKNALVESLPEHKTPAVPQPTTQRPQLVTQEARDE